MTKQSILITYADHGAKPPIYVAGDFTQWEPRELGYIYSLKSDNEEFGYKFFQAFEIEEGTYEYKFVRNNGQWVCSPMFEIVTNDAGYQNNVLNVVANQGQNAESPVESEGAEDGTTTSQGQREQPLEDITKIITDLEKRSLDARTKRDSTAYGSYLTSNPKSNTVHGDGKVVNASSDFVRWVSYKMEREHVIEVTEDVAIIYYSLELKEPLSHWPATHLRSSTWRKERTGTETNWKRIFHQATRK